MPRRPNFMIVITDQQSARPYWPEGWEEENLPAMRWLRENGMSFNRAMTNSCTCSPARVTMLTGLYPAQHGVTEVLEHTDAPFEYEMYDLAVPRDQREVVNLGHRSTPVTPEIAAERERLHQKLIQVMETLGTTPSGIAWPEHWGDQRWSEGGEVE